MQQRIDRIIEIANTGRPGKYAAFVQMAIDVAGAPVSDQFRDITSIDGKEVIGGSYGWRTAGSSSPGGRFVAIPKNLGGVIAGNQYYTLAK